MARVVIEKLSKIFKGPRGEQISAVRDLTLSIEDKELIVLVGPSGAGKSTILRLIAGLEEISSGNIFFDEHLVNEVPPQKRDIAMVFQNYALYPHLSVYDNMALGLKLRKVPKPEIEQRVREAAQLLGLSSCLERKPHSLSGGERQRVAVGRALVRQPKVFLLDEPLSNLDAQMRVQMRAELLKLHRRLGATMIYVTHDQIEAMTMGDRIVVMKQGFSQQIADPLSLYRRPANMFVAGFIGSPAMNFFQGTLRQQGQRLTFTAQGGGGEDRTILLGIPKEDAPSLQAYAGKEIIMGLRPEHIHPAANTSAGAPNHVTARAELIEPMGPEMFVHCTSAATSFVARIPAEGKSVAPSDSLPVRFDMSQAHYFSPETQAAIPKRQS